MEVAEAEQIAAQLGGDVAFLRATQGIYFARRPAWPVSPVFRLLSGIHELEPRRAPFIVRHRVFSTFAATATCHGATRVAGHALTAGITARDHGQHIDLPFIDAGSAVPCPPRPNVGATLVATTNDMRGWMRVACDLAAAARIPSPSTRQFATPVAALMVAADGRLLAGAVSTGASNRTRHAEVNLVEGWLADTGTPLPAGGVVLSTLKPCKMCAGLIWDSAAESRSLRVLYAEDDARRAARETVLDAGSMARKRAVQGPADAARILQSLMAG